MEFKVTATARVEGEKIAQIRNSGRVPVELYGNNDENKHLTFDVKEFRRVYKQVRFGKLLGLSIDGKDISVLIKEVQRDPVKDTFLHVDLQQVKDDEKIITKIPMEYAGESPVVKVMGGQMIKSLNAVRIKCLPNDLIPNIVIDLSTLTDMGDVLRVKDLDIPDGVEILNHHPNDAIVSVTARRVKTAMEQAMEAVPVAAEATEGETPEGEATDAKAEGDKIEGDAKVEGGSK